MTYLARRGDDFKAHAGRNAINVALEGHFQVFSATDPAPERIQSRMRQRPGPAGAIATHTRLCGS